MHQIWPRPIERNRRRSQVYVEDFTIKTLGPLVAESLKQLAEPVRQWIKEADVGLAAETRALRGYGQVDPAARLMALSAPSPLGKTISLRIALFLLEPQRVEIGILYHEAKPDGLPCNSGQWLIRSGLGMPTLPPYRMLDLIPEDQG